MSDDLLVRKKKPMDQIYVDARLLWMDNLCKEREVLLNDLLQNNHDIQADTTEFKERKSHFEHGLLTLKNSRALFLKIWDFVKTHPDRVKLEVIHEMTFFRLMEFRWKEQTEEKSICLDVRCVDDTCRVKEFAVGMWRGTPEVSLIQHVETSQELLFKMKNEQPLPSEFTHLLKKWFIKNV